ncbi:hypothetical protein MBELCI_1444 [Limimaricola cinnabarinus LL-001]|uniref:Uncharacterized protein n=1 Tax=Limimaricola cinnabarinus LL-001 TaxID=1337093 RepID=U2Z2W4_9RHOB|nr:hypothetical protein MBELCI_1444 [Limimaricola cinnabarinus LL-001]
MLICLVGPETYEALRGKSIGALACRLRPGCAERRDAAFRCANR